MILIDLVDIILDINPIEIATGKAKKKRELEKKRHKAKIHYNAIMNWIDSTKILNDERIEFLEAEIERFEYYCFNVNIYATPRIIKDHNEYEHLINNLRTKLKQSIRKAYSRAIVNLLAEKSYRANKLNFKKETGIEDNTFINIFITHTNNKLIIEFIGNNPLDSKKLEFDFPYLDSNPSIPNVYKLEEIFENIIYMFKLNVEYKALEVL
jgi:hypothetical protein